MSTAAVTPASFARLAPALLTFGAGALFAIGLGLSGMTDPNKVTSFLDVTGAWDPSLALVMVGAIAVHALLSRVITKRHAPVFAQRFEPVEQRVDRRLVAGAALFGMGWGLAGYCPGPALVSLVGGSLSVVVFVATMLVGMAAYRVVLRPPARAPAQPGCG